MSTPAPRPQVGDQLTGEQCDALPFGSAVVLAIDERGEAVAAPPSAYVRTPDTWAAGVEPWPTGPGAELSASARFRVLYVPPPEPDS